VYNLSVTNSSQLSWLERLVRAVLLENKANLINNSGANTLNDYAKVASSVSFKASYIIKVFTNT
jgi:hypothetical protein